MGKIEDPALLAQLEGGKVIDPALLQQLDTAPEGAPTAALRGAAQGATLGFGDELEAGWKALFGQPYKQTRDQLRTDETNARQQHPYAYGAGELGGAMLPGAISAATGGAALLPLAAGQGAVQGAGYSNADTAGGMARDTAIGTGVGVLGYGVGQGLGALGRKVVGSARGLAVRADAKAADLAAKEVAGEIASARGALGGEVQKGQRIVENLRRLGPSLTPEEDAAAAQLEARLAQSTRDALPAQAETIASRDAELAALKSGASDAFQARKAELLSPAETKDQLLARALRYGPVAAGTALGAVIGGPLGTGIGALAGAGTRPMVRSVLRMSKNPAVQKAAAEFLENRATGPSATLLRRAIQAGLPAPITQELVTQ